MALSFSIPKPVRWAVALVILVALAGATYQGVTTSLERRRFRHPGRLIDAGGHQLHIHCTGRGTPVVVLEAPAGGLSASWTRVQAALDPVTRVCSYDRAGLGWSERGDGAFDPARVPVELQTLLTGAGERPPFVLAGVGMGAAFARAFAVQFPTAVRSLVLLDLPGADRDSFDRNTLGQVPQAMPWLARTGLLRLTGTSRRAGREPAVRAFMNRPDHLTRTAQELARWNEVLRLTSDDELRPARVPVVRADLPAPLGDDSGADAAAAVIRRALSY
jgi:pimeloyl-ACP methyl ester carboxylesterase